MNQQNNNSTETETTEKALGELLSAAGPRIPPTPDRAERVKNAVQNEWQSAVAKHNSTDRKWMLSAITAAAASVLLAVGVWQKIIVTAPPVEIASVERVKGTVVAWIDNQEMPVAVGTQITVGTELHVSGDSGLTLAMNTGQSIRLREQSQVLVVANNQFSLDTGSIYVDSVIDHPDIFVSIVTPFGSARDIGTQFSVTVLPSAMQVSVREGLVNMSSQNIDAIQEAKAGEQVRLHLNGEISREAVSPYGDQWSWLTDLATTFETNGRTLSEFLTWICRENGWTLQYANKGIELSAQSEELRGVDTQGMSPEQAVDAVLTSATSANDFKIRDGVLLIGDTQ